VAQWPEISGSKEPDAKVAGLYWLLYGEAVAAAMWERYAQALLLVNEFVFVD